MKYKKCVQSVVIFISSEKLKPSFALLEDFSKILPMTLPKEIPMATKVLGEFKIFFVLIFFKNEDKENFYQQVSLLS
jgi:hypothetical protein